MYLKYQNYKQAKYTLDESTKEFHFLYARNNIDELEFRIIAKNIDELKMEIYYELYMDSVWSVSEVISKAQKLEERSKEHSTFKSRRSF